MAIQRKVSVRWVRSRERWEVSFYWDGYKYAFRFYSWEVNGRRWLFTKENEPIAHQYADYIRSLMVPDPRTGLVKFDPTKLTKAKKSKYALSKYSKTWIDEQKLRVRTGQITERYVEEVLQGYLSNYINPMLGDISLYEVDSIVIKKWFLSLAEKELSKKHIQNIMDCLKQILKSACEDIDGFEMPKFPKYREKQKIKIHRFLLPEQQEKVLSFVEPQHKAFVKVAFYGLRPQEIINLKRSDLIFLEGEKKYPALSVETLKGGVPRVIPIDWDTYNEIKAIRPIHFEYLITLNGEKYRRGTAYKAMRRALNKSGLEDFRPYDATRHSRASQLNMMGASAFDIQQSLGHSDIRTSQAYTHVRADGRFLRDNATAESHNRKTRK